MARAFRRIFTRSGKRQVSRNAKKLPFLRSFFFYGELSGSGIHHSGSSFRAGPSLNDRFDGLGPEIVARFVRVELVRHEFRFQRSVFIQEDLVDVLKEDEFPVGQCWELCVDGIDAHSVLRTGNGTGFGLGAREDGEKQDLSFREFDAERREDLADPLYRVACSRFRTAVQIVRADHEHDHLRRNFVEHRIRQTLHRLVGNVAADADIHGLAVRVGEVLLVDFQTVVAGSVPKVGDGVADHKQIHDFFFLCLILCLCLRLCRSGEQKDGDGREAQTGQECREAGECEHFFHVRFPFFCFSEGWRDENQLTRPDYTIICAFRKYGGLTFSSFVA